jgi:hypothetical protein
MADFSMNVNYAKPQGQTLGDMVNMASGIQNFQQAQQMNPLALEKAQIENQVLRQKNDERLKLQEFTSNPENWQTNGRIDMDKINKVVPKIAPLTGSDVITSLSGLHKSQTEADKAKQDLTQTERQLIGNVDHSLGLMGVNDPRQVIKAYQGLITNNPDNAALHRMVNARMEILNKAQPGPNITKDLLAESASLLTIPQQRELFGQKATLTPMGGRAYETLMSPQGITGEAPSVQFTGRSQETSLNPAQREEVSGTDIYGNPITTVKDEFGRVVGQKGVPVMGQPTPAPMPMRFAPGESPETVKAMQAERILAKDSAAAAAPALQNIQTVRKYLPLAATGANSEAIARLQSVVGNIGGSKPEELAAASRDIIEKSIADLALQKNQALGGKYVEDLKGAAQSLASAGRNPTAIAKSMDQLEPLIQHAQYYQQGLENAIAKNKGDVQIKRQFDNAMINAYDPQALGAYNAYKSGGEPALNQYLMDMSPDKKKPITPGQKANIFMKIQKYVNLVNGEL